MSRLLRLMVWGAIASPPTLMIVLSLMPADQLMLWLYGAIIGLFSLAVLLLIVVQIRRSRNRPQGRAYWQQWRKQAEIAFFLVVSVIVFNWPLRIAFIGSRPALNYAAQQLLDGDTLATPCRLGLFRIAKAELWPNPWPSSKASKQIPALWTMPGSGGDHMGFVQSGTGKPPFIMWSYMRLDSDWQFIYRAE